MPGWTDKNRTLVRSIHGSIVGTAVIYGAYRFGTAVLADGLLTKTEAVFVGGLVAVGLLASMPWVFMPVLHWVVDALQRRRKGGTP